MSSSLHVIRSPDVTGHVTIQPSTDDFLYVLNRNQRRIGLTENAGRENDGPKMTAWSKIAG